jgi:hypothetical protein
MTDKEKALFSDLLSRAFALDSEAINSLFSAEGELTDIAKVLDADRARVDKLKLDSKSQYAKGKAEALTALEKSMREQYQSDSDLKGLELIEEIITAKVAEAKPGKLTDDDWEKHPKFAQLKRQHEKALTDQEAKLKAELEGKEREWGKRSVLAKVKERVLTEFESMRPVLPQDAKKAANLKQVFMKEFEAMDYQLADDGTVTVLDGEGKPLQNSHGHLIKFSEMVKEKAESYFDFYRAEDRGSPGTPPPGSPQGGNGKAYGIKSKEDFVRISATAKTPEERIAMLKEFQAITNQ